MEGEKIITTAIQIIPALVNVTPSQVIIDYDKSADVLYINFGKSKHASNSELLDNDIIRRIYRNKTVGYTILNASRFLR